MLELGNLRRVHTSVRFDIGIDPVCYQSGESYSSLSITKHGNAIARKLLYRAIGQIDSG